MEEKTQHYVEDRTLYSYPGKKIYTVLMNIE